MQKHKLNWTEVFNIPVLEVKRLLKELKPDLRGVAIYNKKMYVTDAFYAFRRKFDHADGFVSFDTGEEKADGFHLARTVDQMFTDHKEKIEVKYTVHNLEHMIRIAKLQKEIVLTFSIPDAKYKPTKVTQGDAEYLIMPVV